MSNGINEARFVLRESRRELTRDVCARPRTTVLVIPHHARLGSLTNRTGPGACHGSLVVLESGIEHGEVRLLFICGQTKLELTSCCIQALDCNTDSHFSPPHIIDAID